MTQVKFDYSMLRKRIKEVVGTETLFAEKMGLSTVSLSAKLNNNVSFKSSEIEKACQLLNIDKKDIGSYFLSVKS